MENDQLGYFPPSNTRSPSSFSTHRRCRPRRRVRHGPRSYHRSRDSLVNRRRSSRATPADLPRVLLGPTGFDPLRVVPHGRRDRTHATQVPCLSFEKPFGNEIQLGSSCGRIGRFRLQESRLEVAETVAANNFLASPLHRRNLGRDIPRRLACRSSTGRFSRSSPNLFPAACVDSNMQGVGDCRAHRPGPGDPLPPRTAAAC